MTAAPVGAETGGADRSRRRGHRSSHDGQHADDIGVGRGAAGVDRAQAVVIRRASGQAGHGEGGDVVDVQVAVADDRGGEAAVGGHVEIVVAGAGRGVPVGAEAGGGDRAGRRGHGRRRNGEYGDDVGVGRRVAGVDRAQAVVIGRSARQAGHGIRGGVIDIQAPEAGDIGVEGVRGGDIEAVALRAGHGVPIGAEAGGGDGGGRRGHRRRRHGEHGNGVRVAGRIRAVIGPQAVVAGGAGGKAGHGVRGRIVDVQVAVPRDHGGETVVGGHVKVVARGPGGAVPVGAEAAGGDRGGGQGDRRVEGSGIILAALLGNNAGVVTVGGGKNVSA